jgi:hypothetical protein
MKIRTFFLIACLLGMLTQASSSIQKPARAAEPGVSATIEGW